MPVKDAMGKDSDRERPPRSRSQRVHETQADGEAFVQGVLSGHPGASRRCSTLPWRDRQYLRAVVDQCAPETALCPWGARGLRALNSSRPWTPSYPAKMRDSFASEDGVIHSRWSCRQQTRAPWGLVLVAVTTACAGPWLPQAACAGPWLPQAACAGPWLPQTACCYKLHMCWPLAAACVCMH
eukprot:365594-Chlamydomonas_euryale.AAC.8